MCGAFALLGVTACQEKTSPRLTPLAAPAGTGKHHGYAESTSVVIPPGINNTACPNGRAVFTYGTYSGLRQHVMSVPLGQLLQDKSEPVDLAHIDELMPEDKTDIVGTYGKAVQVCTDLACFPGCSYFRRQHARYERSDSDTWMVRVGKHGQKILYVGLADRYASPSCSNILNCNCDVDAHKTQFGALLVYESDDCGQSWTVLSHIDPTDVPSGDYQSFDREAMYYDHFTSNVYVTVVASGKDSSGAVHEDTLVYRSDDDGKTWNTTTPAILAGGARPNNMTSTSNGLYVARCVSGDPELDFSPDKGQSFPKKMSVSYTLTNIATGAQQPQPCANVRHGDVLGNQKLAFPGITLARGPDLGPAGLDTGLALDAVRVAYPSIETVAVPLVGTVRRSVLRVVNVYVPLEPANAKAIVEPLATIRAKAADASVVQARFIETDRFEFSPPPAGSSEAWLGNAAVLYWLELPSSSNFLGVTLGEGETARWAAFGDFNMVYGPHQLALDNGKPAHWLPNYAPTFGKVTWAGDYDAGAFFYLPLGGPREMLFFLAQWPQSDQPPPAAPNAYLHYNIMGLYNPLQ